MENASRRYDSEKVKKMIERQKEKYGWEFLFLGANIDACLLYTSPGRRLEGSSHFFSELQADPSLAIDFIIAPPRMAYYMESVSYTHLDVYKRQLMIHCTRTCWNWFLHTLENTLS